MATGSNGNNTLTIHLGHELKIASISIPVGSDTEISLVYEPKWVKEGFAISPHLPLDGSFDHRAVRNFLQNLLPEGTGLEEITTNTTISKNNTFGLIRVIGDETSGALSFRAFGSEPKETLLREVTPFELGERLMRFNNGGESITYWDGKTRLSVAGVQDKLNLLEIDGKLGFGEGHLCSNKIFKFETGRVPFIAVNELFTMLLAKEVGIDVPPVELRSYGGVRTFVIDRFDRRVMPEQNKVMRQHVIDGCQATNLPPSFKYERQFGDGKDVANVRDGVSFPKLFEVNTANTEAYHAQLIRWMTFNILVRNYDAHGKNISFFVGDKGLRLTPFYDLVNIEAIIREIASRKDGGANDFNSSNYYAMSIGEYEAGDSGNFNTPFTAYMIADFADEFGISLARIELLMTQTINSVLGSVELALNNALTQTLSEEEINHIDLCIEIIREACDELTQQVSELTELEGIF
ncbi:HipA domain-containing protein [Colwelliaceae bacterium BS250]